MTEFIDNLDTFLFQILILPILYAETHYRFKYFFSYLKKREPEMEQKTVETKPAEIRKD